MNSRMRLCVRALCITAVLCFVLSEGAGQTTTMVIYSNVTGFEVWFDGAHIYTTPADKDYCWFYNVYPGTHTITLKKSGCADATVRVDIIAGATNEFTINMACGSGSGGSGSETRDSDDDGVPDDKDACRNPNCNVVDSRGCPKDSDSDGVDDCDDECPYTTGSASNDGCPEPPGDKDNDGVTDDRDSCYNVGCTIVDYQGCPKDSDSDGVFDCNDDCPTSKGVSSNRGCPEIPGDKDNDGVTDDRDNCYNAGCTIVDSQGCPKDSDSDGVLDCNDDCPYEEGPASNNGCRSGASANILTYWPVIVVLICALGGLLYLNQRRSRKLKM
ncbi:MAG: PEGA domain-containing protein [Candidatus Methanofastidiosia archaeon]